MDSCPAEVLHSIVALLATEDVVSLRLCSRAFAEVGAHYLFKDGVIRFHCTLNSLERLQDIAANKIFSQYVVKLHYEASLILPLETAESYNKHFEHMKTHHRHEPPPTKPPKGSSKREMRLYERNFKKWLIGDDKTLTQKQVAEGHATYQEAYKLEQQAFKGRYDRVALATTIPKFPRLEELFITNSARCPHAVSDRFLERFSKNFFPPLEYDTAYSIDQVKSMILPMSVGPSKLKTLTTYSVSPKLFSAQLLKPTIISCFSTLKKLVLTFRLSYDDLDVLPFRTVKDAYAPIQNGSLFECLSRANGLEELSITFHDYFGYEGACASVKSITGDHSWPELNRLYLSHVDSTAKDFLQILKNQPKLVWFGLSLANLTSGNWATLLDRMRRELKLENTDFQEFIYDGSDAPGEDVIMMDHVNADEYFDDRAYLTVSTAIDIFLTQAYFGETSCLDDAYDGYPNPLTHLDDFVCPSQLEEIREEMEAEVDPEPMELD